MAATPKSSMPLGAQVLSTLHGSLKQIVDLITKTAGAVENAKVKKGLGSELKELRDMLFELEGLFTKHYPDFPTLAGTGGGEVSETAAKSWLAQHDRGLQSFSSIQKLLGSLSRAKNLTPEQRKIISSAKTFFDQPVFLEAVEDEQLQRIERIARRTNSTINRLVKNSRQPWRT